MSYNTKNYTEQGGEITHFDGKVYRNGIEEKPLIYQAASVASDAAGAVVDLNKLIAKLKTAGVMAAVAPTIAFATQPADANVVVGSVTGNMTVLAVVSDGNTPTYQWYSIATDANTSGDAVSGATNATLAIPTASSAGTLYYYCVATCEGVTKASETTKIVATAPAITITAQPVDVTTTAGAITETLEVAATVTGTKPITYQWHSNTTKAATGGSAVSGATTAEFTVPTDATADTYYYYCVVASIGAASVTSEIATVVVESGE